MSYDENLAERLSKALADLPGLTEKKMFGGVGYLLNGNMACGVHKEFLIMRVGLEHYQEALEHPHTRIFDTTGRPMTGWVMVAPEGCASEKDFKDWLQKGLDFTSALPAK
jgi:TfoX/Sxy family transcriptional regulator of competence genes